MDAADSFIDHVESKVSVPSPRQMSPSKAELAQVENTDSCIDAKTDTKASQQQESFSSSDKEKLLVSNPIQILGLQQSAEDMIQHNLAADTVNGNIFAENVSSTLQWGRTWEEEKTPEVSTEELVRLEADNAKRTSESKDSSEYCPGLAIRSLTLEDFQDKSSPSAQMDQTHSFTQSQLTSQTVISTNAKHSTSFDQGPQFTPHKKPLFDPIEVERKFSIGDDTEEKLRSLGAKLHKEKTFTDVYYDNDDYALILSDCWLRRRNDVWEAKIPVKSQSPHALFSPATQYREVSGDKDISTWLVDQLKLEKWMRGDPVDLLVQAVGLTAFAKFTTVRRSYTLPSCVVDLDITDHGFKVGEIEVMAASPEEVPQALHTISTVAQQLGLSPLTLA